MGDSLASYDDDQDMDDAPEVSASQEAHLQDFEDDRREDGLATGPAKTNAGGTGGPGKEKEAGGRNPEPAAVPVRAADAPQEAPPGPLSRLERARDQPCFFFPRPLNLFCSTCS